MAGLLCIVGAGAGAAAEREDFLAAEAALARGDRIRFARLADGLRDYPLYPYLRFQDIVGDLDSASPANMEQFLAEHADTPLAGRLRRAWLDRSAKRGRWQDYLRVYAPDDSTERRCHYLHALIVTARAEEALGQVEPLWLSGKSQPDACDPVFEAWQRAGRVTADLAWARIALAMEANQTGLARYLGKFLPAGERPWLDRWLAVHGEPRRILDAGDFAGSHPQREAILVHGIRRLAGKSPREAAEAWDLLQRENGFPPDLAQGASAAVGFALVDAGDRAGLAHLDRLPSGGADLDRQERRLRAAIRLGDWARVAAWVDAMPDGQRKSEHWLYWQARAEEAQGTGANAANRLYRDAAQARSLWGFLAAERLAAPYRLDSRPTPAAADRIERIARGPVGRRIEELMELDRDRDIRREWNELTRGMDAEDLKAAAVVASRWGWPDQAIFTLAKSDDWDDLALRFPLRNRVAVRARSRATGLDASWIYAIIRQESAFNPDAVSPAGAVGLMQLMPGTARDVARSLGKRSPNRADLSRPRLNIALGSGYLAAMSERYGGNQVLATAAYNAGPGNVDKWLPARPVDADIWVATIPFPETRGYVRHVLAYRVIYDARLGRPVTPLSEIMPPIGKDAVPKQADRPDALAAYN